MIPTYDHPDFDPDTESAAFFSYCPEMDYYDDLGIRPKWADDSAFWAEGEEERWRLEKEAALRDDDPPPMSTEAREMHEAYMAQSGWKADYVAEQKFLEGSEGVFSQDEATQFIQSKMDEVREALTSVEEALINCRGTEGWREIIAELTDEFHVTVHGVIGLFDLSSTPAVELQADISAEDEARWSRFDRED